MKRKMIVLGLLIAMIPLFSCDFRKSINKDLNTGLVTRGNGLSCNSVYLAKGEETIKRNTFLYGEKFLVVFSGIQGFDRIENFAFPGMLIKITAPDGEVVLFNEDLYAEASDGFDFDPLQLHGSVVVADPMHSGGTYHLHLKLWDKKGEGTFTADMDFTIEANDQIKIESNLVTYDEIYLYSNDRDMAVEEYIAGKDETIFILFEGLDGFVSQDHMVYPGLSLAVRDANGYSIIQEEDLMGDSGLEAEQFRSQMTPNFYVTGDEIVNPVTCEIVIWDKKSEARISASVQLRIE